MACGGSSGGGSGSNDAAADTGTASDSGSDTTVTLNSWCVMECEKEILCSPTLTDRAFYDYCMATCECGLIVGEPDFNASYYGCLETYDCNHESGFDGSVCGEQALWEVPISAERDACYASCISKMEACESPPFVCSFICPAINTDFLSDLTSCFSDEFSCEDMAACTKAVIYPATEPACVTASKGYLYIPPGE
jgi:hypothetical protein